MTTDAPGDMIRMQNSNQAKRRLPEMAGAAIFIPERRIPSRTLLSFACGITAAPRKAEVLQAGHFAVSSRKEGDFSICTGVNATLRMVAQKHDYIESGNRCVFGVIAKPIQHTDFTVREELIYAQNGMTLQYLENGHFLMGIQMNCPSTE